MCCLRMVIPLKVFRPNGSILRYCKECLPSVKKIEGLDHWNLLTKHGGFIGIESSTSKESH